MPSAPSNTRSKFIDKAAKLVVLLGDNEGNRPTEDDEIDYLIPQRIGVYANGGRDDVMTFKVDLKKLEARLQDTTAPLGFNRQLEIRVLDDDDEPTILLAWGVLARQPQTIDESTEGVSLEVRLDQYVFGKTLTEYPIYDPEQKLLKLQRPVIMNPEIDEIIEPNMSDRIRQHGDDPDDEEPEEGEDPPEVPEWHYFIDPESVRTNPAIEYQQQHAGLWTLQYAVFWLCQWLNADEHYIKNPTMEELEGVFGERDTFVKNIELPFGAYLPACLDALLIPAEFGWHLVSTLDEDGQRETRMRFYARGEGVTKSLYMQRTGQVKSLLETNIESFAANYSIVDLANRIDVFGGFVKREITVQLRPGWDESDDSLDLAELETGQPTATSKPYVGRKWILDTAGDYIGRRAEFTAPWDPTELFPEGSMSARRRKFEPCLSQHGDDEKESNRIRADWFDADEEGASDHEDNTDPGWLKVKWPFSVLEKEAGILFEGPTPPDALWALINEDPSKARVRITACLRADTRIKGTSDRREDSPNGMDLVMTIDTKNKFQDSAVDGGSIFHDSPSLARNDQEKIDDYAEQVRDIEDAAQIACSVRLEGIEHPEYELGDLIDNVSGRNLSLNSRSEESDKPRRPQIIGFNYIVDGGQYLEIILESFKFERPQISKPRSK